jgi:hypothetical protein
MLVSGVVCMLAAVALLFGQSDHRDLGNGIEGKREAK